MRRLIRPLAFLVSALGALGVFIAVGRVTPEPMAWRDLGGWLDRNEPTDVLAELARYAGMAIASYVGVMAVLALIAEVAALIRLRPLQRLAARMLGLVAVPALHRRLVELGTVATVTAASLHAVPAGAAPRPPTTALVVDLPGTVADGIPPSAAAGDPVHVVRSGDTLGRIIEDHYGRFDTELLWRIVAANPQIENPNLILVGWAITLPDMVAATPTVTDPVIEATWAVVTVQRGDTLWEIVDRHYGGATSELIWRTIDANPEIENPDLIFAGQKIVLPPMPTSAPPEAVSATSELPHLEPIESVPGEPSESAPSSTSVDETLAPSSASAPQTLPTTSVAPVATTTVDTVSPTSSSSVVSADDAGDEGLQYPSAAARVGWFGGATLAAALLALAAVRRRNRRPSTPRHRPSRQGLIAGAALRETPNLSTAERAANALRVLGAGLRPIPGEPFPAPRLLRLDQEEIELIWESPTVATVDPWLGGDGWVWTLQTAVEVVASDGPQPCPTLVTIGRRHGADVLLNLETCGILGLVGDPSLAHGAAISMTTELAASPFGDRPTLLIVDRCIEPIGAPENVSYVAAHEAAAWMRHRAEASTAALSKRRLSSLFALRARSRPTDEHEPLVVVADLPSLPDADAAMLVDAANGDLGVVLIAIGCSTAEWRLTFGVGAATLSPSELTVDVVAVTAEFTQAVEKLIPEADEEFDEFSDIPDPNEPLPLLADASPLLPSIGWESPLIRMGGSDDLDQYDLDYDIELKVLGQVRAVGVNLKPTELHLAIYLAFHRHGENADTISCMIWPEGTSEQHVNNTMSSLRRKLGLGSDGQPLFPHGRENDHRYTLSPRVVTDWDRFVNFARLAESIGGDVGSQLGERARRLVDGPPFRAASGYSWAFDEGTVAYIERLLGGADASVVGDRRDLP